MSTEASRRERLERLAEAVLLYICGPSEPREGWRGTWEEVAAELGVSIRTLYRARKDPVLYEEAFRMALGEKRQRLAEIAFRRLASSAEAEPGGPGVAAANSLLDRIGYPATQRSEVRSQVAHRVDDMDPEEAARLVRDAFARRNRTDRGSDSGSGEAEQ